MKKTITCILVVFQILMLSGCSQSMMNQQKDTIISDGFSKTINNYYYEDNGSTRISIYSYSDEISPILTLSLQNLFDKHDVLTENMIIENNVFFYSVIKSIYENKNYIDINQLTKNSSQYDFYLAFKIADLMKDKECLTDIKKLYNQFNPKAELFSEKIYESINLAYQGNKINYMDSKVTTRIEKYAEGTDYDFDSLTDLNACLNYINIFEIDMNENVLNKVFNVLSNYDNEMYILSQGDIIASQYMDSLSILAHCLGDKNFKGTFFDQYLKENKYCYQPIAYEIVSLRNFALYITALYYDKNTVDDNLYNQLLSIADDIRSKVSKNDYASVFYYNYICDKLNISDKVEIDENKDYENMDNTKLYFYSKLNGSKLKKKNMNNKDILYQLMYLDICEDKNDIKKEMASIDIYKYGDEKDFPLYLNLYASILVNNELLSNNDREKIKKVISNKENIYGYSGLGNNYDFEASCYYIKILNTIEGGVDSGLR